MQVQHVQLRVALSGRYATALYKEASETKNLDGILHDITIFETLLKNQPDLAQILKGQLLRIKNTMEILEEIGRLMNFSKLFVNFLKIVATNRRCALLLNIFKNFKALVDLQTNTVPVRIEVVSINEKHLHAIEDLVKKMYPNQFCRFEHAQVPELLGGFRAFISERCLDYSLRSRLNRLSYQLKEA
jgi:F-type H+-transporting ATPase subunit delta